MTELVPRASESTGSSLLWRTPSASASCTTRGGPTFCMSCAVMVFLDCARPSCRVVGRPVGGVLSVGLQTSPPPIRMATASSMKVSEGLSPSMNAAP